MYVYRYLQVRNKQTKLCYLENSSRIRIRNPVYGSKDPDPKKNVMDSEHCLIGYIPGTIHMGDVVNLFWFLEIMCSVPTVIKFCQTVTTLWIFFSVLFSERRSFIFNSRSINSV